MASAGEADGAAAIGDDFTDPLVDGKSEQEINIDFLAHDDFPPSKNLKEKSDAEKEEKKDGMEKLKSALLVSGAVIAVIGAIFALAKKIKEA